MTRLGWGAFAAAAAAWGIWLLLLGMGPALGSTAGPSLPSVAYAGPRGTLSGIVRLGAAARTSGARIVAVTYLLDGKPLGSDATAPYALDVDTRILHAGRHTLRVTAVDGLGRTARGRPIVVRVARGAPPVVASPTSGLPHALAVLRRGGETVLLRPGRYALDDVVLGNGARLVGSGPQTVVVPGQDDYFALLSVHGSGVRIADLTVDGGGPGAGEGFGIAVADGSSDVRLQRLRLVRVRGDGVNVWGRHADVSVQDSMIEGSPGARAGVRMLESDDSHDVSVIRTRIRAFQSYGIDFAQRDYGRPAAGLHALALGNTISDIRDPARAGCAASPLLPGCGTNEAGIQSGAAEAAVVGNTISRTAWDGIETVGSSTHVSVVGNVVGQTRTGIYLEHATTGSLFARNVVSDVLAGINVEWRYGSVGSSGNVFSGNRILRAQHAGLFLDVGADRNQVEGNVFVAGARPAIVLQGSSQNVVRANRACQSPGPMVREQDGSNDDGSTARSADNRIVDNIAARCGP